MQQPPSAADLLAIVVEVLTVEVVPALTGPAQHNARVAANVVAIVERELRLGDDAASREHAVTVTLLDEVGGDATNSDLDLASLRARLAAELRRGMADDDATNDRMWRTLMAVARDDLTIAKPGHDEWDGD